MTRIWVLDRSSFLRQRLVGSTWIEDLLIHGVRGDVVYALVIECIERVDYVPRLCRLIRAAGGTARLVDLQTALPMAPALPSAFAGTLKPAIDEPMLQSADGERGWHNALLNHLFLSSRSRQKLVLHGPPGCGKSLALERVQARAAQRSLPHLFVSGTLDRESNLLVQMQQFFSTVGARSDALFVLDDVEALAGPRRAGEFLALIGAATCRCVIVCNDAYDSRVRTLHKKPELYRFVRAAPVDEIELVQHLQHHFAEVPKPSLSLIASEARGDVRAAQLAAELEQCAARRVRELTGQLDSLPEGEQRAAAAAAIAALTRRLSMPVDSQQHAKPTDDLLRCVRAKMPTGTLARHRSRAVVEQCSVLLQPRAADSLQMMQSNYARLCESELEMDLVAELADDVSSAFAYRYEMVDAMMANTFSSQAPDTSVDENFKEQLLFDVGVVLPCVRASRANVGRGDRRSLKYEFPEYGLLRQMDRVSRACRDLDARHEVVVRTTTALREAESGELTPELEERARVLASKSLTAMATYRNSISLLRPNSGGSGREEEEEDAEEGGGGGERGSLMPMHASIDRLERTLFVFQRLVAGADMQSAAGRKEAIGRCTAYGFDADMYAHAALFYKYCKSEAEGRQHFAAAKQLVLHENRAAIELEQTVQSVPAGTAGGGGAAAPTSLRGKRSAPSARKKSAPVVAPTAPTFMDKFVSSVKRSKGGDV